LERFFLMSGSTVSCALAQVGHWKSETSRISIFDVALPRRAAVLVPSASRNVFAGSVSSEPRKPMMRNCSLASTKPLYENGPNGVVRTIETALMPSGSGNGATVAVAVFPSNRVASSATRMFVGRLSFASGITVPTSTCCVFGECRTYFCVPQYWSVFERRVSTNGVKFAGPASFKRSNCMVASGQRGTTFAAYAFSVAFGSMLCAATWVADVTAKTKSAAARKGRFMASRS
jgi:hypothetical protein